jgi:hypothetical protein
MCTGFTDANTMGMHGQILDNMKLIVHLATKNYTVVSFL